MTALTGDQQAYIFAGGCLALVLIVLLAAWLWPDKKTRETLAPPAPSVAQLIDEMTERQIFDWTAELRNFIAYVEDPPWPPPDTALPHLEMGTPEFVAGSFFGTDMGLVVRNDTQIVTRHLYSAAERDAALQALCEWVARQRTSGAASRDGWHDARFVP